jgi:hypothetical protein
VAVDLLVIIRILFFYTRCTWAGGTFLRCLRKVPRTHSRSACVLQELGWALVEVKSRSDRGEQIKPVVRVISIKYANQQT